MCLFLCSTSKCRIRQGFCFCSSLLSPRVTSFYPMTSNILMLGTTAFYFHIHMDILQVISNLILIWTTQKPWFNVKTYCYATFHYFYRRDYNLQLFKFSNTVVFLGSSLSLSFTFNLPISSFDSNSKSHLKPYTLFCSMTTMLVLVTIISAWIPSRPIRLVFSLVLFLPPCFQPSLYGSESDFFQKMNNIL